MNNGQSLQEIEFSWLLQHSNDLIISISTEGKIINISASAAALYGSNAKSIRGHNFFDYLEKLAIDPPISKILLINKEITTYRSTQKITNPHHTNKHIEWLYTRLENASNDQQVCILLGKDITQQHNAEQQIRNTKLNLQHIVSCMPGNIYWMDKELAYLGCNQNTADLVGLKSPQEIIGKTYEDFVKIAHWDPAVAASFKKDDLEVLSTGQPKLNIEEPPVKHPNGKIIYYLTSRVPIKNEDGNITGIVGVSIDITERKNLELELYKLKEAAEFENKEKLEILGKLNREVLGKSAKNYENIEEYAYAIRYHLLSVISAMPWNVYWMDKNLVYLGCNQNAAELIGLKSPADIVGKTYEDFIKIGNWDRETGESFQKDDLEVIATGKAKLNVEEPPVPGPKGEMIYFLTSRVPLRNESGEVTGVVGISVDITELKKTQQKLKQAEIRIDSMMSLSASIAHELRTPLTSIQAATKGGKNYFPALVAGYKKAKEHKLDVEPIRLQYLQSLETIFDSIESETRYSNAIINMILMNLRQVNIPKGDFQTYSISECVEEAIYRYPFKENQIKLINWHKEQDFSFKGDKTLLVHVIFNLLKNALYYIQAANKGHIEIWTEIKNNNNIFYFKDTAQGIPPEVFPNLFEKFYTTTRHGTGLGLAYCKMVMEGFGGSISCQSQYQEYTQFEMVFPK